MANIPMWMSYYTENFMLWFQCLILGFSLCYVKFLETNTCVYVCVLPYNCFPELTHQYTIWWAHVESDSLCPYWELRGKGIGGAESQKSEREKQIPYANTYIWNLKEKKKDYEEPRGGSGIKTQTDVENGLEDTGREKGKLGWSETVAWTYIHYQM